MRRTLKVLSNLRAVLVFRAVYLGLLFAVLCAASSVRAHAVQVRSHHRSAATAASASSRASHRKAPSAHNHATTKSPSRAKSHSSDAPVARRRTPRHEAETAVLRTRGRSRSRRSSWRITRLSAVTTRPARRYVDDSVEDAPMIRTQRTGVAAPPAAMAEDTDPPETNSATPQQAARQIAAAEIPAMPHPSLHAATPTPEEFRSTRIIAMAPLRGSIESLIRQNEKTNADNLERIEDDADLNARIASGQLVRVPESAGLVVNPSLPENRRYCRPWTAAFLTDLARAHQAQFHRAFIVSSAVRTVEYQKRLMRTNGNAAPAEGDIASPHLTGATIDIAKSGLSRSQLYWMRNRLDALQNEGKIDVEEEFRQSCFHITVYKSYIGAGPAHKPTPGTLAHPDDATQAPEPDDLPVHPA